MVFGILLFVWDRAQGEITADGAADQSGGRIVVIDGALAEKQLGTALDYVEDPAGILHLEDVTSVKATGFKRSTDRVLNFGLTSSAYWVRFTLRNPSTAPLSFCLAVEYPLMDNIRLYVPEGAKGYRAIMSGDTLPYRNREFQHRNFVFPLQQGPGDRTYYMRFSTTSAMTIPIAVFSLERLYRKTGIENGVYGVYYGMLIVMLLYNLFILAMVRGRDYLFYVLYVAGALLASLVIDGFGASHLWPAEPRFSISSFYNFLVNILYLFLTRELLNTKLNTPRLDKIALANIAFGAGGMLVNLYLMNSLVMSVLSLVCTAITIGTAISIVAVTLHGGVRLARFYLAALSLILVGAAIYALRVTDILPVNLLTMWSMKIAILAMVLVFSFALADKINTMRKRLEVLNANLEREVVDHIHDKEALKRSEERFRGVVERNFDVIFMMDTAGHFSYVSPSITAMTGYRVDEFINSSMRGFQPSDMFDFSRLLFGDLLKGKEIIGYETVIIRKNGTRIHIEVNLSPIMKGETVTGVQGIARDITERKMAEEALMEEKERLSITLRSIAEGVIATDIKWRIHIMNKAAEELTAWRQDQVLGRTLDDVLLLVDRKTGARKEFTDAMTPPEGQEDYRSNTVLVRRDKSERIVSDRLAPINDRSGKVIGYVVVIRDITEEVKFRGELQKMEKLESIGILAGGIAHDFNNILTAIMGNINLSKLISRDPRLREILDDAEKASVRAQELTQQFLTFSRGGAPVRRIASIEEIIRDSSRFTLRGSNVRSSFHFQDGLRPVNVDVGQLSQVMQNLVINADQAMPDGGDIVIIAENVIVPSESVLPLKPGQYVKISVTDTGIGIPAENLSKIFDPYFTTKSDGNGLGLTSTFSIIKRHDGYISVESEPGKGTTFYLYLPSSEKQEVAPEKKEESSFKGKGRVLFMDDDEAVNTTARKMLEHLGFAVECALDGEQAVKFYERGRREGAPYDLVILDLTIPGGMGGKKTIEKLLACDPDVRAIVSSGYSNDMIMANFREYGFKGVIAKPYRIDELAQVIEQVMGSGS